jgi:plasmid maintenance system antidote protein VapI
MQEQIALQKLLAEKLTETRIKNPSYSLRAFARKAGLSPSALSEILSGKRRVSKALAFKIVHKLCLEPDRVTSLLKRFPEKLTRKNSESAQTLQYTQLNRVHLLFCPKSAPNI